MIRFIDLTGQIYLDENEPSFAFYDTVRDKFCEFSGTQNWDSIEEFKQDYIGNEIERFLNLIPDKFKNQVRENHQPLNIDNDFYAKNFRSDAFSDDSAKWNKRYPPTHWQCTHYDKVEHLESLKKQLKFALDMEDFETCFNLQNQIKELENKNR